MGSGAQVAGRVRCRTWEGGPARWTRRRRGWRRHPWVVLRVGAARSVGVVAVLDPALDDVVLASLDDVRPAAPLLDDGVLGARALGVHDEPEDDREGSRDHEDDPDRVARPAAEVEDARVEVGEVEDRTDHEKEDPESDTHVLSLFRACPPDAPLALPYPAGRGPGRVGSVRRVSKPGQYAGRARPMRPDTPATTSSTTLTPRATASSM